MALSTGGCDENLRFFKKFSKLGIHKSKFLNVSRLYASFTKKRNMVKAKSASCPAALQTAQSSSGTTNVTASKVEKLKAKLIKFTKSDTSKKTKKKKSFFLLDDSSITTSDTSDDDSNAE